MVAKNINARNRALNELEAAPRAGSRSRQQSQQGGFDPYGMLGTGPGPAMISPAFGALPGLLPGGGLYGGPSQMGPPTGWPQGGPAGAGQAGGQGAGQAGGQAGGVPPTAGGQGGGGVPGGSGAFSRGGQDLWDATGQQGGYQIPGTWMPTMGDFFNTAMGMNQFAQGAMAGAVDQGIGQMFDIADQQQGFGQGGFGQGGFGQGGQGGFQVPGLEQSTTPPAVGQGGGQPPLLPIPDTSTIPPLPLPPESVGGGGGGGGGITQDVPQPPSVGDYPGVPDTSKPGLQDLVNALADEYKRAYDEARDVNEQRYNEILQDYQKRTQEGLDALRESGRLQAADVEARNQAIMQGYQDRFGRVLGSLDDYGKQALEDLNRRYDERVAAQEQDLISRGLGNTTVLDSMRRGLESERQQDINRLEQSLLDQTLGYDIGLSGDTLGFQERGADQLTNLGTDVRKDLLAYYMGLTGDQLQFMERRQDTYPSLAEMLGLAQQLGLVSV